MLIPKELQRIKQWSYSYSLGELKRPTHTKYTANGALSMAAALKKAGKKKYIGFYVTEQDPYVLIDIDHIENPKNPFSELPVALAALLQNNNTYSEVSPSGHGLRVIFRLPHQDDKQALDGQTFYVKGMDEKRNAQVNFGKPWMTITLNETPFAMEKIAEVSMIELEEVFNIRIKGVVQTTPVKEAIKEHSELPPLGDILLTLGSLPLDQNNRIIRAYESIFRHKYQHYDYWVRVLMALHDYAERANKLVECMEAAVDWSRKDPDFQSEEDVAKHWRSFSDKEENVSYKTLYGLFYKCILKWPMPRKQSKDDHNKNRPRLPLNTEYVNFKAMFDYYDFKLYRDQIDSNLLYLSGDADIIEKHFMMHRVECHYGKYYGPFAYDTLTPAFHMFCQTVGFIGAGHQQITNFVSNQLAITKLEINFIRLYFDTPFKELPPAYQENAKYYDDTNFDKLFACFEIEFQSENPETELQLYKRYYESWWMGVIRNLYYRDEIHTNNCVLLLTGKEQIRKTSHFKYLLPSFMREHIAFTTHGFSSENSVRDVCKLSATNLMIVWDELEQYLNTTTEPNFKKIIDNNPQKMIDKYQVIPKQVIPIAIYGATSNIREFKLGHEGSRRLFHIPVKWVDTDKLLKINWHKMIKLFKIKVDKAMATGVVPWLLEEDELELQISLHKKIRSSTAIDIVLGEIFDDTVQLEAGATTIPGVKSIQAKSDRAMTTKEVVDMLVRYGTPLPTLNRPAVVKALERLCGNYTRTRRMSKDFNAPKCRVTKGLAKQSNKAKWVMPPMYKYAFDAMYSMFER